MCYDECSKIDKRLWLFGTNSFHEMESVLDDDNRIIIEELRRLRMNNEFIDEYDYENVQRKLMNSNRNEGYKEGFEVGITQGISQRNIEIAKNLLNQGVELNVISKATSLTIQELNDLIQ